MNELSQIRIPRETKEELDKFLEGTGINQYAFAEAAIRLHMEAMRTQLDEEQLTLTDCLQMQLQYFK